MPSGSLMQIVAYGAQDLYLSANPQVTFFKAAYRRHTNFAHESLEQTFSGSADFGRKITCELQRAGDLVTKMFVRTELPAYDTGVAANKWAWCSRVGHALLTSIELDIGGIHIDKQYGDWLNVWYELSRNFAHDRGYNIMIGNTKSTTTLAQSHAAQTLWIPLQFACCRNDGLALPIIALQYHEVRVNVELRRLDELVNRTVSTAALSTAGLRLGNTSLYVDYVYLDNDERKRFAQASHEYLFEQLQFTGDESVSQTNSKFRLNLNHPVKEIIWTARQARYSSGNTFFAVPTAGQSADEARLIATKRFILRLTSYTAANTHVAGAAVIDPDVAANTTYESSAGEDAAEIFAAINAYYMVANTPDIDNITIMGRLLTLEEFSQTVDTLLAGLDGVLSSASNTALDSIAASDVVVYQWDNYGVYLDGTGNPCLNALLQLNGHDRFSRREGDYFNYVNPWQSHRNTPCDGLNTYSFALQPEEHQPSGSCNFSRIDNATLGITFEGSFPNSAIIKIYAVNINVLRVMSGMGGLAYSS